MESASNFIRERVQDDNARGTYGGRVVTRFPPEPNGHLHIGHAKSICLNFGLARDFGGVCHLRMDDTNPTTEHMDYVDAIKRDVRWLGFDWGDKMFFASDYYQRLYDIACEFIRQGKAYVDDLSEEDISKYRGTVTEAGKPSPFRDRSPAENLDLLARMNKGEFAPGSKVLRAKGDLANPNMKMRDPLMYRIKDSPHYRTGTAWRVYPFYDFAHCFSDAFEGITHSICTLEFENNRELYDWYLAQVGFAGAPSAMPRQHEFARLNIDYTVLSKRKLLELVRDKHVSGWDDPRMPTITGLRRRGYSAAAIRRFCDMIGVAKSNSIVDIGKLEFAVREDCNGRSARLLAVIDPIKLTLRNWPKGKVEHFDGGLYPQDHSRSESRQIPMSETLYIERDDFMEQPPSDFHRLKPGGEVRLRFGYVVKCEEVVKDAAGQVSELICSYDPASGGGQTSDGRKVKGIIHWVSAAHSVDVEVRLYDRLFKDANPDGGEAHFLTHLNPDSLKIVKAKAEPFALSADAGSYWQFERVGFFFVDPTDSKPGAPVFNRTVTLKDSWNHADRSKAEDRSKVEDKPVKKPVADKPQAKTPHQKTFAEAPTPALAALRAEYMTQGLSEEEAALLTESEALNAFFEQAAGAHRKAAAGWVVNELLRELKTRPLDGLPFSPAALGELIALMEAQQITRRAAKDVFAKMLEAGGKPAELVDAMGLRQTNDTAAIEAIVKQVLEANPAQRAKLKAGETKLAGFFVGQIMKASKGQANALVVQQLLDKLV